MYIHIYIYVYINFLGGVFAGYWLQGLAYFIVPNSRNHHNRPWAIDFWDLPTGSLSPISTHPDPPSI